MLHLDDGTLNDLGPPQIVDCREAEGVILEWQAEQVQTATIVRLDKPTIVKNAAGQRPVENLVGSPVSLRYGGMQPANTAREEMFGKEAPVWRFLTRFGGPADPLKLVSAPPFCATEELSGFSRLSKGFGPTTPIAGSRMPMSA